MASHIPLLLLDNSTKKYVIYGPGSFFLPEIAYHLLYLRSIIAVEEKIEYCASDVR